MLALILLVTQLISAFWLWHESQNRSARGRNLVRQRSRARRYRDSRGHRVAAGAFADHDDRHAAGVVLGHQLITRPLNQLQQRLEKRSADNLTPLPINSDSLEMVAVTNALNQLFSRLDNTIQQERLFTADAAHEPHSRWPAFACIWN